MSDADDAFFNATEDYDTAVTSRYRRERDAERALADDLAKELSVAREAVENWGSYADAYFKEKWDLAGDLARIDAALDRHAQARR